MPRSVEFALALSVAFWAGRGFWNAPITAVALGLLALQLCVAALLVMRRPLRSAAPTHALILAAPAVLIAALVLKATPSPASWSSGATFAFLVGTGLTLASLSTLGRSFAVLPGVRELVVRGPFRLVRHPAYLGQSIMVLACLTEIAAVTAVVGGFVAAALLVLRIHFEEEVLRQDAGYRDYASRVRWRLIPGLW